MTQSNLQQVSPADEKELRELAEDFEWDYEVLLVEFIERDQDMDDLRDFIEEWDVTIYG